MSSSSDASALRLPELRIGAWTRYGGTTVLGDGITESLLGGIAEEAREAARAQGYSVGWAEGRRAAAEEAAVEQAARATRDAEVEARRDAEHRAALAALGEAAERVRELLDDLAHAVEAQATDLAWSLTTTLLGLQVDRMGPQDVVTRVLQVLPPAPIGTVRLHPAVAASDAARDLVDRGLEVVADAALDSADAVVEGSDGSVVDLRIAEAMARVREVFG
ncbi:hypothetical protein ACFQ3F_25345 [Nocardioides ginsengisoli]|uniref:Flagellar assembly protein FliH/Type III secretion system HrpE domain-containing protein n=1 Tax=Nocardioides ginsengisoli TaxID=363868 RepID=A0ABW3W7T0_9ACTN